MGIWKGSSNTFTTTGFLQTFNHEKIDPFFSCTWTNGGNQCPKQTQWSNGLHGN